MNSLSIAVVLAASGMAMAEDRYYDPTNQAATQGKTVGYELYGTIGCPGKQLLDPSCKPAPTPQPVKAAPAPSPCPLPKGALQGDKVPMNAQPGQCFVKIVKPATFRTETQRKLVKEASEKIEVVPPVYKAVKVRVLQEEVQEVVPAVYETVKERVLVKEASTRLEEVPPVYEEVEERVVAKPASQKAIEVPAVYEDVTERKLVREAYTTWKPGTESNIQRLDEKTGQIMCLVAVPAEYTTITRKVLKTPASVRYEEIPAEYTTIKKTVLKTPATTRTVQIPAEYAEREVKKLVKPATTVTKVTPVDYEREIMTVVQPATEKRIPVPAEYAEVQQQVMACPAQEYWSQILCDVNATPAKIMEIQRALQAAGFNPGPVDGNLGNETMAAVTAYQKAKNLPVDGYLNAETVKALGVALQ